MPDCGGFPFAHIVVSVFDVSTPSNTRALASGNIPDSHTYDGRPCSKPSHLGNVLQAISNMPCKIERKLFNPMIDV